MCASHVGGAAAHRRVRRLLRRGPVPVAALRTPRDRATKGARSRIWDGCSGNHAGLLVASAHRGWDLESYRAPSHPVHRRVLRAVTAATDVEGPRIGVDGCGIPVHGVPIRAMATMFARLGTPDRLGRLAPAADRVVRGMLSAPHMVGGTRRLDTDVMTAGAGKVVAKEGAEGLVCATSLSLGIGIALKVSRRQLAASCSCVHPGAPRPGPHGRAGVGEPAAPRGAPRPRRGAAAGSRRGGRPAPAPPVDGVAFVAPYIRG